MALSSLQHWYLERDSSGLAWLTLDCAGASVNTLSLPVLGELETILDQLDAQPPAALVIRSGKAAGFIAGADVEGFTQLTTAEEVEGLIGRGWHLFNRLARVGYPTLALVRGHCLGGGLELALACRYRIVVDEPGTRLGLPEVLLGIVPGWGGMARLPARVGPQLALDMMLTGKTLDARRAARTGLADAVVPARIMDNAVRGLLAAPPPPRHLPWLGRLFNGPLKSLVAAQARKQAARKAAPEYYPAPYAIIDCWAHHGGNALATPGLIDTLAQSPTTRNLIRLFFLQERLKAFGKESTTAATGFARVHVVGAGVMGGDIAAWCALRGMTVTLEDQSLERITAALARAAKLFARRLKEPLRVRDAQDRLIPDVGGAGVAKADVVIEAIYENLEAKQALLRRLEVRMKPGALLASNTSSLRLEELRTVLQRPEQLVGIHFFNPVAKMPLVEVVAGEGGDPQVVDRACAFVRAIDRLPLPVRSAPGFLVNAVLAPYMLEAMRCVDEGVSPEAVDAALLAFGMPMGPITLADTVGLDVALAAGRQLAGAGAAVPRCLQQRVDAGKLGRKSGEGFYPYGSKGEERAIVPARDIALAERLIRPLVARTAQLVAEGVVADADLADAGVVFGTGFAPFTGGPLHYRQSQESAPHV